MTKSVDIAGQRFGRLFVIERGGLTSNGRARWRCLCDCGKQIVAESSNLRSGRTKSCGCIRIELLVSRVNPGKINRRARRAELAGQQFGRLAVTARSDRGGHWKSTCDCGTEVEVSTQNLRRGYTRSCGCLHREATAAASRTHGLAGKHATHPLYKTWLNMTARCRDPGRSNYRYYGGRGITVCDRWLSGEGDRTGFECFIADMGPKPTPAHTLDRYPDNNGNYEPGNCRWATQTEQVRNSRKVLGATEALQP